jgi:hypothetical protein
MRTVNKSPSTLPNNVNAVSTGTGQELLSIEKIILDRLFTQFGPLIDVDQAWPMLGFPTRDAFNRATQRKRIPLQVIRPKGRRISFVGTIELAKYFASLTQLQGETPM